MKLLLIDTCGEVGLVAVSDGADFFREAVLLAREASRALLDSVGKLLSEAGWTLSQLDAIAIISGPGLFTGVRVGMSAAKGLAEATGVRLISISRLAALANASAADAIAVLDAGRGEFYVRTLDGHESLLPKAELFKAISGKQVVTTEAKTLSALQEFAPENVTLSLQSVVPLVTQILQTPPTDAALVDANYVRREQDIYAKAPLKA